MRGGRCLKLTKNKDGFTLIEVMMVVAILGILFAIVYNFLGFNFHYLDDRNEEHDYYLEARIAMSRIEKLLLDYNEINVNEDERTVTGVRAVDDPNESDELTDYLIDYNKNTVETPDLLGFRYYLYCPACTGSEPFCNNPGHIYQIMSGGNVIVEGVKEFNIILNGNIAEIELQVINKDDPSDTGLVLTSGIRTNRKMLGD
jgi:prepilin-type N-terminal cleavage/methylation domain-containing protein